VPEYEPLLLFTRDDLKRIALTRIVLGACEHYFLQRYLPQLPVKICLSTLLALGCRSDGVGSYAELAGTLQLSLSSTPDVG